MPDDSYHLEVIRPDHPRGPFLAAIFDFDGTLSLVRRNWQQVMVPMMVAHLQETGTSESTQKIEQIVTELVTRLTGKQTIYQMIQLAEEIRSRGGQPLEPLDYKHQYHELLWEQVGDRVASLKCGEVEPDELTVPGSRTLLSYFFERDVPLYLASGTDIGYVKDELAALELDSFFGERVYGAVDDFRKFSKAMIIQQIIEDSTIEGHQLIGFGDGYVEIEEIKKVGGLAIGVASEEETRQGFDSWKRARLIEAGADIIVGDYREIDQLVAVIGLDSFETD